MKIILIILVTFSLTGCFWQGVNNVTWEKAAKICKERNATVLLVDATFLGIDFVTCSDWQSRRIPTN